MKPFRPILFLIFLAALTLGNDMLFPQFFRDRVPKDENPLIGNWASKEVPKEQRTAETLPVFEKTAEGGLPSSDFGEVNQTRLPASSKLQRGEPDGQALLTHTEEQKGGLTPLTREEANTIPVWIKIGEKSISVEAPAGGSAYDAMAAAQEKNLLEFRGKEFSGLGFFVEEINGMKQDFLKRMVWIYYLNGNKAKVGISNTIIQPDDVIEWKYEPME